MPTKRCTGFRARPAAEPSSDIYSLAKLLLEMLTGRQLKDLLPDAALDLPERVRALARKLEVRFSDASIEMLATALEFDPARRPHAAGKPALRRKSRRLRACHWRSAIHSRKNMCPRNPATS